MLIYEVKVTLSVVVHLTQLKYKMECHFNFNKKTITRSIGDFLWENLPNEIEHIKRIMSGKKLQYMEANQVLRKGTHNISIARTVIIMAVRC